MQMDSLAADSGSDWKWHHHSLSLSASVAAESSALYRSPVKIFRSTDLSLGQWASGQAFQTICTSFPLFAVSSPCRWEFWRALPLQSVQFTSPSLWLDFLISQVSWSSSLRCPCHCWTRNPSTTRGCPCARRHRTAQILHRLRSLRLPTFVHSVQWGSLF